MGLFKPWLGPLGGLTWGSSLLVYEACRFGRYGWWWRLRWGLARHYALTRPDDWVRALRGEKPGSLAFGETPCMCVARVLSELGVQPGARWVDLGSGRGITCLTAAALGYPSHGVEFFAEHVERSQTLAEQLGLDARFSQGDILECPWPPAELYFVASTAFPDDFRSRIEARLEDLPGGTWVVTHDWLLGDAFYHLGSLLLPVSWGTASYCLQRRRD